MSINLSPEALLTQLDYPLNEHTLEQMNKTLANTKNFGGFSSHLLSLKDNIVHYFGFIAMSNSHDYLKIKCEEDESRDNIKVFKEATEAWGKRYKVTLEQVGDKPTYYIIGQQ